MASFYVLEHIPLPRDKAFSVSPQNNTACAFSGLQFLLKHDCFFIVLSESSEEPYLKKKNNNFLRLGRYIIIIFSQMFWIFCFCFFFFTQREYDKMVEEKDTELKLYKIKEQEQLSSKRSLVSHTLQH